MEVAVTISTPLELPCGLVLRNRIVRPAMSESMCWPNEGAPTAALIRLYTVICAGGPGMCISGNAMVDARYRENPRNLVADPVLCEPRFRAWADLALAMRSTGCGAIVQLSHPGRQCPVSVTTSPVAASAVPCRVMGPLCLSWLLRPPRALTATECDGIVRRFAAAAAFMVRAGFDGVQVSKKGER
jgi:2,4-dienoyl-CoA reductase-like NADH-dependent reductase (Old Yellow Enzyme family)